MVDVDVGLHDPAYVVDVAAFAGRDDRDAAVAVADRQVGVGGQQGLEHRDAAGHAGDQPRGVVPVVERVRVGPEGHKQPGDGHAVVRRREQQRGPVVAVAGLEVRLAAQHQRRRIGVAVGRGGEQPFLRGRAPYVFCIGGLPEQGRDGGLTHLLGVLAGGQAVVDGGMPTSAPAATRTRTVSTYRSVPSPRITDSWSAVQPRLFT